MSAIDRIVQQGAPKTAPAAQVEKPKKKGILDTIEDFAGNLFGQGQKATSTSTPAVAAPAATPAPAPTGAIGRIMGASKAPASSNKTPNTVPAAPGSSAISRIMNKGKETPPYFGTTTDAGISFGPSPEKDKSGRPFIEYKLPGQTASTTDKTRTSTTFNPMVAAPQTKDSFYNPRAVEDKAKLRIALGGAYSDELDHKIAVALSGSNDTSNLRPEPAAKNNDSTKILELQQKVVAGKMSLFDAQVELAKWKGVDIPWTPQETKKYSSFDGAVAALSDAWKNKVAPAIEGATARRDQNIEQPYFEPRKKGEAQKDYAARLNAFQNSPEQKAYEAKVKKAGSFGGIVSETIKNLPNKFIESTPATLGVGAGIKAIRDDPTTAAAVTPMDAVKAVPGATLDVAKGFVKAPISGALNIYGAVANAATNGKQGAVKFNIPGLGEVSNAQSRIIDRINNGEDAGQVALEEGSQSIFDTLFFIGVASKAFAPRTSVTAKFEGDMNNIKGAAIDTGPRSFREYTPPSTAAPLTPEVINAMSKNGMELGPKYDPTLPSYFRIRATGKGGGVIGEVVQIKPSYFDTLISKITPKTKLDYYRGAVKNSEAFNVDKAIKDGSVPKEAVYTEGKILTPEFAEGRINDIAQKLDMYKPGLGAEFKAKVDINNTSLTGMIEQGEAMLTPAILKNPSPAIQNAIIAESIPKVPTRLVTPLATKKVALKDIREGLANPVQEAPVDATEPQAPNPIKAIQTQETPAQSRYIDMPADFMPTPSTEASTPMDILNKHSSAYQALEVAAEANVDQELKTYQRPENLPEVYSQSVKTIEQALRRADTPDEKRYWNQQLSLGKFKVDYVKRKLAEGTPAAPEAAPETAQPMDALRQAYNEKGAGEYGMSKADETLGQILIELELAEKGSRVMTPSSEPGVNYVFSAKRSTFPDWIPENLRSRKAIDILLSRISSIDTLAYPAGKTATAQRAFVDALLDTLDDRLGVDTKAIRENIKTNENNQPTKDTPAKEVRGGAKGDNIIDKKAVENAKSDLAENKERQSAIESEIESGVSKPRALKLNAELQKLKMQETRLNRTIKDANNLSQVSRGPAPKKEVVERNQAEVDRTTKDKVNDDFDTPIAELQVAFRKMYSPRELTLSFPHKIIPGKGNPNNTIILGRARIYTDDISTDMIKKKGEVELLQRGGKGSSDTLYHEAFHPYFNLFAEPKLQKQLLNKVIALDKVGVIDLGVYDEKVYPTAELRAEEYMADDFKDYAKSRMGGPKYQGFFARLWSRFMDYLAGLFRRFVGTKNLYDDILAGKRPAEVPNEKGLTERYRALSEDEMKHISEIIESGASRAAAKKEIEQAAIRSQNKAREIKIPDESLLDVFKNTLNPLKGVDPETATIFRRWRGKELVGEELARNEKKEAVKDLAAANIPDDMTTIDKYEAGQGGLPQVRQIFDNLYAEAGRLDDTEVGYIENYIPHVYSNSAAEFHQSAMTYLQGKGLTVEEAEDYLSGKTALPQAQARRLGLTPFFVKERMFESYKAARQYGLIPKYKTVSDHAAYYRGKLERALANRYLKETLETAGKILPDVQAPPGWSNLNPQFSALETYKAPAQVARIINDIFPDTNIRRLGAAILEKTAKASKGLQEITLSGGFPATNVNFFSNGQLIKEITAGNTNAAMAYARANLNDASAQYFEAKSDIIMKMAEEGIDLSNRLGKWGHTSFTDMVQSKEWGKAFGKAFDAAFNEKTFGSFMPQLQIGLFEKIYKQGLLKGMSPKEAQEFAGETIKHNFGLLTDDFARSKVVRDFLSTFFFAPQFREGILRMLTNAGYAGYDFARHPFSSDPTYRRNLYFLAGLAITYALYNIVNKQLNGTYLWQNPPGREFALRIPRANGDVYYIEILPGTMAFPRALASGVLATAQGDLKTATQKFGMLFSQPVHLVTDVIGNEDYYGRPIYNDDDTPAEKAKKIGIYVGLNASHPWVRETVNQVQQKNPLYQSVSAALELPLKFSTEAKEAQSRIYDQADEKSKELKQAKDDFRPKYDEIRAKIDGGDKMGGTQMIQSLDKAELTLYKSLQREKTTEENKQANKDIATTYEKIQELVADGETAAADAMYNDLTADEKKAYQRLKKKAQ